MRGPGPLLVLVTLLAGCADRLADDEVAAEPACMILPARGYWSDGSTRAINDESGYVGSVCECATPEEFESTEFREELNDRALAECKRIDNLEWDFEWTDCEESYQTGAWLALVFYARGEDAHLNKHGLICDAPAPTCAVQEQERVPVMLLVALATLGYVVRFRRRSLTLIA